MFPRRLYFWLFLVVWAVLTAIIWATGDWNAYYDVGRGPEVKFRFSPGERLAVSALVATAGATLTTGMAWLLVSSVSRWRPHRA